VTQHAGQLLSELGMVNNSAGMVIKQENMAETDSLEGAYMMYLPALPAVIAIQESKMEAQKLYLVIV
jgi:hypothetical protein